MAKFVPVMVGLGLFVLAIALLVFFNSLHTPSGPSSNKPVGTSTLGHGGAGPTRQSQDRVMNLPDSSEDR
jgi:hypothetical protein